MKRLIMIMILGLFFGSIFTGCAHSLDKLSRYQTGRIGPSDFWQSAFDDDKEMQRVLW